MRKYFILRCYFNIRKWKNSHLKKTIEKPLFLKNLIYCESGRQKHTNN